MGKTGLQKFNERVFAETPMPRVGVPSGDGRPSRDERGVGAAGKGGVKRGRPAGSGGNLVAMNILLDAGLKERLGELRVRLHRGSMKDLVVEALNDLLEKYSGSAGREGPGA